MHTLIGNAADYSDALQYGDYLYYKQIDEDEDGTYDYVEISDCETLATEIEIPAEIDGLPVTSIGDNAYDNAFMGCYRLTHIEIPDNITTIGSYTFSDCISLENITIPESVASIGEGAFNYCKSLTSIEIPSSVTSIESAFNYCSSLTNINVSDNNENYSSIDGVLFNKDKTELIKFPEGIEKTEYIIPNGVTLIGEGAFSHCSSLTSITIPEGVTNIGGYAFYETPWLKAKQEENSLVVVNNILIDGTMCNGDVIIPDSVTAIADRAFEGCSNLISIDIPNSVTSIGEGAFSYCSSLTSIAIPEDITKIAKDTFRNCSSLLEVNIPANVELIENCAFYDCSALDKITINNKSCAIADTPVTFSNSGTEFEGTIYGYEGSTAQSYAKIYGRNFVILNEKTDSSAESLSIGSASAKPGSIVMLPINVSCNNNFESMDVDIQWDDGCIYKRLSSDYSCMHDSKKNYCEVIVYGSDPIADGTIATITFQIPDDAEIGTVYDVYFSDVAVFCTYGGDCIEDKVAVSGGTITVVGDGADDYLSYIKYDMDSDGTYDYIAISECDISATNIEIPSEIDGVPVTLIGDYAFSDCSNLASIEIPESLTSIGNGAFEGCSGLTSIEIPDSVTSIGESAFEYCSSLTNINVSENNKNYSSIDGILFNKDKIELIKCPQSSEIKEYIIPNGITSIADEAFEYCINLTSIEISDSVTSIGDDAFSGCSGLESITIPDSVTSIGDDAFWGCSSLESITISDSVTSIGYNAFSNCISLTNINVSENNKDYSSTDGILFNKDKTELIKCPQSSEITEYIIPNGVTSIADKAFEDCSNLISIEIPDSVISIGFGAFSDCSSLKSITIENPECEIDDDSYTIRNGVDIDWNDYFNGIIYGYENSTAQAYAEKYGYNFKIIGEGEDVTEPTEPTESVTTTSVTTTVSVETSTTTTTVTDPIETTKPIVTTKSVETTKPIVTTKSIETTAPIKTTTVTTMEEPIVTTTTTETTLKGDVNGNGIVDVADAVAVQKFLSVKQSNISDNADINKDGLINVFDLCILKRIILEALS